ncbi:MAG: TIGR01620 family protein [Pseudomonadota bacterium]
MAEKRKPRTFRVDDPALSNDEDEWVDEAPPGRGADAATGGGGSGGSHGGGFGLPTRDELADGFRWGSLFFSAMFALAALALGVWFTRFASAALQSDGLVGWLATSLFVLGTIALVVLCAREVRGFLRLSKLADLRADVDAVLAQPDPAREQKAVRSLVRLYAGRESMERDLRAFRAHQRDVQDAGDLLRLADRDLLQPLDVDARRIVLRSAKRVSLVTALSPFVVIDMIFVFFETLRMLRGIATLYGGRPGFFGGLKLARMVLASLIAAGGIALTDDLLGQFLGQDLLRRLSRKLGEGAFNGALMARMGVAAIGLTRPVPHIETQPVRLRDVIKEVFRRTAEDAQADDASTNGPRGAGPRTRPDTPPGN